MQFAYSKIHPFEDRVLILMKAHGHIVQLNIERTFPSLAQIPGTPVLPLPFLYLQPLAHDFVLHPYVYVCVSHSVMSDSLQPHGLAHQALLSMEFSWREYWSGLPFPSSGYLPNPTMEHGFPALHADSLPSELPGKPLHPYNLPSSSFHKRGIVQYATFESYFTYHNACNIYLYVSSLFFFLLSVFKLRHIWFTM